MARRIKGITVEIGGDTTKLQTALKGVNTEIKNTESKLRDVNRLLKLDPGNTDLLAQKHRLLGDAVEGTKKKLETLKLAQEQANEALKSGAITQEQYDGLQREIVETENKLKSLEEQAGRSAVAIQEIASKGESLKTLGNNISGVGKKMLPVTGVVAGLGVAAVKTASDFDSAMSQVKAVSGATGSDFDALRDKAREMGAKTKFSASEAADALNYMAMAGWKTGDMLDGIEGVMNLAAASGEDLALTSDIVTDALTAFGLKASDSAHFADILAAASSNSNTNVAMMGETFKYCAPIAGALGFSAEDAAEAIGLMANAGIKSSQAGTALRTIMNNLTSEIQISGAALGEVTIQTTNTDGSMRELSVILGECRTAFAELSESEKAQAAEALVGKNAMSGFLALMNAGEEDVRKLSEAISDCDGASEEMALTMQDNLEGQLTILKSQLEELAISIGDMLMPAIRTIVGWIQGFVDTLNQMDEGTRKVIVTIALVVAAIAPVLIGVGKVISAVGTIMTIVPKLVGMVKTVKTALSALHATMLANPIALVIAAIVALVAAFVHLWNNSEEFREFWINLWESIKETVRVCWDAIKTTITNVVNAIGNFLSNAWNAISSTISSVLQGIYSVVSSAWNGIINVITTILNAIASAVSSIWNGITGAISTAAQTIYSTVSSAFQSMLDSIGVICGSIYSVVKGGFDSAVGFVKGLASEAFTWGVDFIGGLINGIRSMIGKVGEVVSGVAEKIRSFLHFSVPDEGPLTDYETWMPDFMSGLAKGIHDSRGLIKSAMYGVSSDLTLSPRALSERSLAESAGQGSRDSLSKLSGLLSVAQGATATGGVGDIVIPVYIGGEMLDEIVVTAEQRMNLRSGGR